jgi:hypothetical protein
VRKIVLSVVVFTAAAISATSAFAADMTRISSQQLSDMFKAAGATKIEVTKPEEGVEIVSFDDGNGMIDFVLMNCKSDGCATLQMTIAFEKDDRFTLSAINSYNAKILNAQAAQQKSGHVTLVKLYVPGGGVTEENLKLNIAIFLKAPELFVKHVQEQVTVSLNQPGAVTPTEIKPTAAATQPRSLELGVAAPVTGEFDVVAWRQKTNRPARRLP